MATVDKQALREEAEARIAEILQALEEQTGALVRVVEIEDMDVTTMGSGRKELLRSVVIHLDDIPGSRWSL